MSKLVGACGLMSLDELRVRSPLPSNRSPALTSNRSAVVCRDSACASPRRLQAAQVVETKRELLDRDRAMAAAAAVAERPILSHAHGRQSDRHRPHRGCVEVAAWQAAEGLERQSLGWQPCLLGLGLGSWT